jgi:zinc transporter ZupT
MRDNKNTIQQYLSLAAGLLLSITIFHFLPESIEHSEPYSMALYIAIGFYFPIAIQRYSNRDTHHFISLISLLSFSVHAFFDGLLIDLSSTTAVGVIVFLSVLLHRLPVAFSLYTIMKTHAHKRQELFLFFGIFVGMTPLGILLSEVALRDFFMPFWNEISAFTIGMFIYISLYHLLIEHKLINKKNSVYIAVGFIIPFIFMFVH